MKTHVPAIIVCYIAFTVLASCKRISHTDTSISGRAFNQTDDAPLVGYEVNLVETETPSGSFSSLIITTLDTRITDASGRFDFGEVELRKRSRFAYTVKFNGNEELFASQDWQEGNYDVVQQMAPVDKGETNEVMLNQVAFGEVKIKIMNHSVYETLDFTVNHHINGVVNPSGIYTVPKGDSASNTNFNLAIAGTSEYEYFVSDPSSNFKDTVTQSVHLERNERTNVDFVYPPEE